MRPDPQTLDQLPTPSLVVERGVFEANVAAMAAAWPGPSLRPHVKAFKSTAIARILAAAGHEGFCAATVRELEGLAAAGLGRDLLLPGHLDPTVARHQRYWVVDGDDVVDCWPIDLRHW